MRWHLPYLPEKVNTDTFRLRIGGEVENALQLSLDDLKNKFPQDSIVALAVCAGNARSFCDPRVPGGQWKNGAMGNAKWKGVKLKSILDSAKVNSNAISVSFNGLDGSPLPSVADFEKSLSLNHAVSDEILVAYEMNGESLPWLNGYPLKLIVPGWYATYWVGMLSDITVHADTFEGYWMKKAYLIPKGERNASEKPDSLSKEMEPINKIDIRSIFVTPEPDSLLKTGVQYEIQGLAFDAGDTISKVEISTDNGTTWRSVHLDPSLGRYAWRRWRVQWKPEKKGNYEFKVKATNEAGETQPDEHWNRSGYMRNLIETLTLTVQ